MSRNLRLLLAGLQAGMAGGLLVLIWLAAMSLFYRHTVWWVPNLYASTFFGDTALRENLNKYTWSGMAFLLAQFAGFGALFAVLTRQDRDRLRAVALGILASIGWYYLTFHGLWKTFSPLMLLYSPDRPIFAGHLLFGVWLGRTPLYARRLE